MFNFFLKPTYFKLGAILAWLFFAVGGLLLYTGSSLIYTLFSVVFLCLLVDGFSRQISLAYTFLIIFLWLGFWMKLILHLWLDYPYLEPIGYFDESGKSWDTVLLVSTVGALGVLLAKIFASNYIKRRTWDDEVVNYAPRWYPFVRPWLWALTWVAVIIFPVSNFIFGIAQVGLLPTLILPWPLNGIYAWSMGFGLAALVATLAYWDHSIGRGWLMGLAGILGEGFISSISILSRATYIFHTLPYLIVLYTKRFQIINVGKKVKLWVGFLWLFLLALSVVWVMILRYADTSNIDTSSNKPITFISNKSLTETGSTAAFKMLKLISHLFVDRWIGLEGVMSIVAYPNKSNELFIQALKERRVQGKTDFYTLEIARVELSDSEVEKFQYATIPGGIAFFYYTGSLFFVLIGLFSLTCLMFFLERAAFFLTRNPYLCALWSMSIAQTAASFGLAVGQTAIYYLVCFFAMMFIWILQKISPAANLAQNKFYDA
jgi:hypothetical protein